MKSFWLLLLLEAGALGACQPAAVIDNADYWAPRTTVFFDSGSADLTVQAKTTLAQMADSIRAYKSIPALRYAVIGYTDAAGSAAHNLALGQKRAEAVKGELINDGIAPDTLRVFSKGKADLLVQTKDGRPEHQNRRVEVQPE